MSLSNTDLQREIDDCHFEHLLSQWYQQLPVQLQVADALTEASAAFTAQFKNPDGLTFMQTCDELLQSLNIKVSLGLPQQKSVVQVLQIACAMHENAVNNPSLTATQRSSHYLATASLLPLCKHAVESTLTDTSLWCEAVHLYSRAERALDQATQELDLTKYLNFDEIFKDDYSGDITSVMGATPSLAGASSESDAPSPSTKPATHSGKGSAHVATGARNTGKSVSLKEKALAALNDHSQTGKTAPLGRRHTMPALQAPFAPYPSRTSKARSGGRGLQAVQETEE